ncbi:MAG: insulinase family protein [Bacteroidia bacterium]|nr:insulinase family protein [Bacteroidia bacterium]
MKRYVVWLWSLMLVLFLGAGCKSARVAAPETPASLNLSTPLPLDPAVRTGVLPNGMTYYVRYNAKPEQYAELRLAVNAGALQEEDDQLGLAHFTEHMCFNGTRRFPKSALVDFLEGIGTQFGAHLNAYTSFDETVYMLRLPTQDAATFQKGISILEDWAGSVSFEGEEIDKERGVVVEEWRTRLGAADRLNDKTFPKLFYNSRYAERLPIGKKEILETFPHETIRRFYRTWYRPDLMAIVAVGDFNVDSVERMIKANFSQIPKATNPTPRQDYAVPDHAETLIAIETDPEAPYNQVQLMYKHASYPTRTLADYRQSLIRNLCSDMIIARLSELQQQPNPPFSFAYSYFGDLARTRSVYTGFAITADGQHLKGLEALLTENERAMRYGFTATELDRARQAALALQEQAVREQDKTPSDEVIDKFVYHYLEGAPAMSLGDELKIDQQLLPTITLEEINTTFRSFITEQNRVILLTGPQKAGVSMPTEQQVRDLLARMGKAELKAYVDQVSDQPLMPELPKPGSISAEKSLANIGVQELTLSNGARVILKPTDFQNDQVYLAAFSPGGTSRYGDEMFMSASRAADIVASSGVADMGPVALEKYLSGKVVQVRPYISELEEGINAEASVKDLETMFQLVNLYMTRPRKDADAFASYISRVQSQIAGLSQQPELWFRQEMLRKRFNNHRRREAFPTPARMAEINHDQVMKVYGERFADASGFTFVITGSFTQESIRPLISTYLASLPATRTQDTWQDVGARPVPSLTETFYKGREPKCTVDMNFDGSAEWNADHRLQMSAMMQIYQIMLRESMREDQGGVYGVRANGGIVRDPQTVYNINIGFVCAPENVAALTKTVRREADSLRTHGPSAQNMQKMMELMSKEVETGLKQNPYWHRQLISIYKYDLDPARILSAQDRIQALTPEDIRQAAVRYLDPARLSTFVLKPEEQ